MYSYGEGEKIRPDDGTGIYHQMDIKVGTKSQDKPVNNWEIKLRLKGHLKVAWKKFSARCFHIIILFLSTTPSGVCCSAFIAEREWGARCYLPRRNNEQVFQYWLWLWKRRIYFTLTSGQGWTLTVRVFALPSFLLILAVLLWLSERRDNFLTDSSQM